jgi:mRNA interferase MazF
MITSNMDLAYLPGNLPLEKAVSGLDKSSVVNFSQIATIDKSDLSDLVCMLPKDVVLKAANLLKQVLDIS